MSDEYVHIQNRYITDLLALCDNRHDFIEAIS